MKITATKVISGIVLALALTLGVMSNVTVPVGEEGTPVAFGEVKGDDVYTGFNWIPFWYSVDMYNLQERTSTYQDLGIASQDKFKTYMDTSFTGAFLQGQGNITRRTVGTSSMYMSNHVNKRILSCLTKAGGEVINSQAFFEKTIQESLASSTLDCANTYLATVGGYKLSSIQFSNIRLDKRVEGFMVLTKKRQEAENQAQSELTIAETKAQKIVKVAKARLDAAENNRLAAQEDSDAKYYDKTKEAEGNVLLNKSITRDLVSYIEAQRWNGSKVTTLAGKETNLLIDTRK